MKIENQKVWCEKCGWVDKGNVYPLWGEGPIECCVGDCTQIVGYTWDKEWKELTKSY